LQGGQRALDSGDAASAAWIFNRVARAGGRDAEAASYWQAYAEHRAGRHNEALETLHRFERAYPQSRWLKDAKALRVEAERASGKAADTQSADEELKLYALDGLMQMDPEKALPILKRFLGGKASPQLKERALFIASQTELPEANALVLAAARDATNPELQRRAIQIVGQTQDSDLLAALRDVYRNSKDPRVKQAVLEAYMIAEDEELLLAVASSDPDPRTRGQAAELLGAMGATDALRTLYKQEKDPEVRQRLINGLMIAGETGALLDVAKNDSNARARRSAIHLLGSMGDDVPEEVYEDLYRNAKDAGDRDAVIDALQMRESAGVLVKLFRLETDPARKRRMLQALSMMDAPEAEKLLMEILDK
jgi:HEAT repeat protein